MKEKKETALILIGEKNHKESEKEQLLKRYTNLIKQKNLYGEVKYKLIENKTIKQLNFKKINLETILIIPFSLEWNETNEKIIPDKIGLKGRRKEINGKEIIYGKPIGYDDFLLDPILERARRSLNF